MKSLALAMITLFSTCALAQVRHTKIESNLNPTQSATVQKLTINSLTNTVDLSFRIERCTSQGSHAEREYSRVVANLEGKIIEFVRANICTRTPIQ